MDAEVEEDDKRRVTEDTCKGDVWSLGITFLELALLERPTDISRPDTDKNLMAYMDRTADRYCDLIRCIIAKMLKIDEEERMSFKELREALSTVENIRRVRVADPTEPIRVHDR
jgi:serine/threonine protein kinase